MNGDIQSQTPQMFGSFCQGSFVLPQFLPQCIVTWSIPAKLFRFHNEKISNSDTDLGSPQTTLWHGLILFLGDWKETGSGNQ